MSFFTNHEISKLTASDRKANSYVVVKDNAFDDIINDIHHDVKILKDHLRPAQMSRGEDTWTDEYFRGDSLCWITPALCEELKLRGLQEYISRMMLNCSMFSDSLGILNEGYNVQFAVYPGKGEGYNRHKDAFLSSSTTPSRQLTCLLYLNKFWEPNDGGQLRVFTYPGIEVDGAGVTSHPFNFWGVHGADIDPLFGRLVAFRSELVEHAVLPCFSERMAITFWANGTGPTISGNDGVFTNGGDETFIFAAPASLSTCSQQMSSLADASSENSDDNECRDSDSN